MSVSYGGDSITFADGSVTSSGWTGFKNRIINGAITIDQRNGGSNVAVGSAYTVDRWKIDRVNSGGSQVYFAQQSTDAPAGFTNSLLFKVTTGAAPSGSDYVQVNQYIEGYNLADMGWGTSSAKTFTVSFWAKCSLATTLSVTFRSGGFDRSYVAPFTITTPNTWQYVTITVPGCTDGTWYTNNGYGLDVHFCLGASSYYGTSTTNTWLSNGVNGSFIGLTGNGIIATTGATFQFTGFQLEKGSTASSFEWRPYGTEFDLCRRYYERINGFNARAASTSLVAGNISYYPKRATPTFSVSGAIQVTSYGVGSSTQSSATINLQGATIDAAYVDLGNFSSLSSGAVYYNYIPFSNAIIVSSEL